MAIQAGLASAGWQVIPNDAASHCTQAADTTNQGLEMYHALALSAEYPFALTRNYYCHLRL
jgi:hypothetical protein